MRHGFLRVLLAADVILLEFHVEFTDEEPIKGENRYYMRVEQT